MAHETLVNHDVTFYIWLMWQGKKWLGGNYYPHNSLFGGLQISSIVEVKLSLSKYDELVLTKIVLYSTGGVLTTTFEIRWFVYLTFVGTCLPGPCQNFTQLFQKSRHFNLWYYRDISHPNRPHFHLIIVSSTGIIAVVAIQTPTVYRPLP